jgi:uncharacterized cupin superfamily protein
MKLTHLSQVPVEERLSPKGNFALQRQHVSLALGGVKDGGDWAGGHPFDIEHVTLLPGKKNYPLHSHAAQSEHYIILSGEGYITDGESTHRLTAGTHLFCPPGQAHQIVNDTAEPLTYYVIADHHRADVSTYTRTGKRHIKPEYRVINPVDVDYYADEE